MPKEDGGTPEDQITAIALGAEIRDTREHRGWTRDELVARLPSGIGNRTLLSYEHGTRAMSALRFVELCLALNEDAGALLTRALKRVEAYMSYSLNIDLRALAAQPHPSLPLVELWARRRQDAAVEGCVTMSPTEIEVLATLSGWPQRKLAGYLVAFHVAHIPKETASGEK